MKRITFWVLSTLTAVVLLFSYSTSSSGPLATTAPTSIVAGSSATTSSTGTSGSAGSTGSKSSTGTNSGSTSSGSTTKTVTGAVASTQWGPVQVELTVSNSKITKVDVLQYPNGNSKDAEINDHALPILTQETLNAQSAQIDMVSGATVTSTGYVQSLQSALDEARL